MSPTKKRQTMGKMTREREPAERVRALKQEKKDGKKLAAAADGAIEPDGGIEAPLDEPVPGL